MRKILGLVVALLSSVAMANDKVSVTGLEVANDGAYQTVRGFARNISNERLANVFLQFKLYDREGNMVGNTTGHGQNVEPGETWKFSIPAAQAFDRAQLSQVVTP